ncbi:MAG: hypothetical protein QXU81_09655 [Candidatus Bathyarchaeia archaeon]
MTDTDFKIFLDDLVDCLNEWEEAADRALRGVRKLKVQIARLVGVNVGPRISEETFACLKWQPEKGARLGDYECAYKNQNILENWQHAYNILKANNSVIGNPFHEEGYQYRYWIYPEKHPDRIFRKKLEEAKA